MIEAKFWSFGFNSIDSEWEKHDEKYVCVFFFFKWKAWKLQKHLKLRYRNLRSFGGKNSAQPRKYPSLESEKKRKHSRRSVENYFSCFCE